MNSIKRLTAFLLAALTAAQLISCGNEDEAQTDATAEETLASETETEEEADTFAARKSVSDDLPEAKLDGKSIRILHFEKYAKFVLADEMTGEVINDAVYTANRGVESRFDCLLTLTGQGISEPDIISYIRQCVNSSEDAYDFAFGHDMYTPALVTEGCFTDLLDKEKLPYLNYEKPWWSKESLDEFTVMGRCYMAAPQMSYMGIARSRVLLMNEDLMTDYQLAAPYQDVIDGKWTLDKLLELTKDFYEDVNADGTKDEDDLYGYVSESECYGYLDNFGIQVLARNEAGEIIDGIDEEKMTSMLEKMYGLFHESKGGWNSGDLGANAFVNNKALFSRAQFEDSMNSIRECTINYGILPMPKYDEYQESYITSCGEFLMVVPITLSEQQLSDVSMIIEAMTAEGYKQIFPAYYENVLESKYFSRQSAPMLEIIDSCRRPSFSFVNDSNISMALIIHNLMGKNAAAPSANFASYYKSRSKIIQKQIKKLNESYAGIE